MKLYGSSNNKSFNTLKLRFAPTQPSFVQGAPWVIARLTADIKTDGRISVDGRGLLLAGTNGIGTNGNQSVRARLFCGGVAHDSVLAPLQANGDFRIDDVLSPLPTNPCDNPVLLIVNAGGAWFAAGGLGALLAGACWAAAPHAITMQSAVSPKPYLNKAIGSSRYC